MIENSVYSGAQDEYDANLSTSAGDNQHEVDVHGFCSALLFSGAVIHKSGKTYSIDDLSVKVFEHDEFPKAMVRILRDYPKSDLADIIRECARDMAEEALDS